MIFCRSCQIGLPNDTVHCPMCQRNLRVPVGLVGFGLVLAVVLLVGVLWGAARLKNEVAVWEVSNADALRAAEALVMANPSVHNPVAFSGREQTTVERWDGRRWRISGYVDTRPRPGVKVRTLYFAVLLRNGGTWAVEDLQLQNMESVPGPRVRGN